MGDISKHFNRSEFECKCCGKDTIDVELVNVLEMLRNLFNAEVIINSGHRCFNHNKEVGGSPKSTHMLGKAADIVVKGIHPKVVYDYLDMAYPDKYGLGLYQTWVHIDVRKNRARW